MRIRPLVLTLSGVAALGLTVACFAIEDCDGSNPTTGECGAATSCQNSFPQATPPTCVGNEIFKGQGQFGCTPPANDGKGSTLCGNATVSIPVVCTTRQACAPVQGGGGLWACQGSGASTTNSTTTTIKDNVVCNDTAGG